MDNGRGRFAEIAQEVVDQVISVADKEKVPIFTMGETLTIRGSSFRILSIDAFTGIVTLKLMPRNGLESLKNGLGKRSE